MLDMKNQRILAEMDFNCRKSDAEIGRAVGLSKQNVRYRIGKLLEEGVVTGFYPVIDNGVRGYYYCRLFLSLQNLTPEAEEKLRAYVVGNPNWVWSLVLEGKYDLALAMWAKGLPEFRAETQKLAFRFGSIIKEKKESVGLLLTHLPIIRIKGKGIGEATTTSAAGSVEIDKLDDAILRLLSKNARMPTVEIAKAVGLSPNSVKYRISKMVKSGVLKAFRPAIDHRKLGMLNFKVLLYLKEMEERDFRELKEFLKLSGANYIIEEIGVADLDFEIMFSSYEGLLSFMHSLRVRFPTLLHDYELLLLKETVKIGYLPPSL